MFEFVTKIVKNKKEPLAENYEQNLKHESQKFYFWFILLTLFCWLPYIEVDRGLSQYPQYVIPMRWGLSMVSLLSASLYLIFPRLRRGREWLLKTIFTYLMISVAFITAFSEAQPNYVGGYFICILCTSVLPLGRLFLMSLISFSITLYLIICFLFLELSFESVEQAYGLQDLMSVWMVSMIFAFGLNRIRKAVYLQAVQLHEQGMQLEEHLKERTVKLKESQEHLKKSLAEQMVKEDELLNQQSVLNEVTNSLKNVQEKERTELADHLHDTVGQHLAVSKLKISEILGSEGSVDELKNELNKIAEFVNSAITDTRLVMNKLSLEGLDDLDLKSGLDALFASLQNTYELKVHSKLTGLEKEDLNLEVKRNLFRTVQELLMTTVKHSGVKKAYVSFSQKNNKSFLMVSDEGKGFDVEESQNRGYGIRSIKERCHKIGIGFEIKSSNEGSCFRLSF